MNARYLRYVLVCALAACGGSGPTGSVGSIVTDEPVFDASATLVYEDNMNVYTTPAQMWSDFNNNPDNAQITTQEQPTHPGWEIISPGRGGGGKALRVNYLGQHQTGASWMTVGVSSSPTLATHFVTYWAKLTFSLPLTSTLGVKWFEGVHSGGDRIQWHMHWLNATCGSLAVAHNTFWQVMDKSRPTACQAAQPIGPYVETVANGQWHRFTFQYRPNTSNGARNGIARMWVDGVKILDVSSSACGITPPGGIKPWCHIEDVDELATADGISALKFGDIQTTDTPTWTLEVDDLRWWRR